MAVSKKKNTERWILSTIALATLFCGLFLRMEHWSLPYRLLFVLFPFFINTVMIFGLWPFLLNLPENRSRFLLLFSLVAATLLISFFPAGSLPFILAVILPVLLGLSYWISRHYVFRAIAAGTISLLFIYGSFLILHLEERLYWSWQIKPPSQALYWKSSGKEHQLYQQARLLVRFAAGEDFFFHDDLRTQPDWQAGPLTRLARLSASATDPGVPPVFTLGCGDTGALAWKRLLRHREHSGFLRNLEPAGNLSVPGFVTVGRFFYQDLATTQAMQFLVLARPGAPCNFIVSIEERRFQTQELSGAARAWLDSIRDR